jgi:hypothetical protein
MVVRNNAGSAIVEELSRLLTVAFLPDGQHFLTTGILRGGLSPPTLVFGMQMAKVMQTFQCHADSIIVVAATPHGKHVLNGGEDQMVPLWTLP